MFLKKHMPIVGHLKMLPLACGPKPHHKFKLKTPAVVVKGTRATKKALPFNSTPPPPKKNVAHHFPLTPKAVDQPILLLSVLPFMSYMANLVNQ